MTTVSYFGIRENGEARVFRYLPGIDPKEGKSLDLRFDLPRHSPTGPEWGYGGSGPAQLRQGRANRRQQRLERPAGQRKVVRAALLWRGRMLGRGLGSVYKGVYELRRV